MAKLIVLRGLPASGKTVHSLKYVQQGFKRVSVDDLRLSIDNGVYYRQGEQFLQDVAQTIIALALQNNFDVISDNCNLNPYHINYAKSICRDTRSELQIIDIITPLEVCIERDLRRNVGRVGRDVIMKMYTKYFGPNGEFPGEY